MSIKHKWLKKLLSAALCVTMLGGTAITLPAVIQDSVLTVSAATDAIGISTVIDLQNMSSSGNYILLNDIDLSELGFWSPIDTFTGTLDGNGHTIKNLRIGSNGFIRLNQGVIKNLTFTDMYRKSSYFIKRNEGTLENITVIDDKKDNYKKAFVKENWETIKNVHISVNGSLTDSQPILCTINYDSISYCSVTSTQGGCMVEHLNPGASLSYSYANVPDGCLVYESKTNYGAYEYSNYSSKIYYMRHTSTISNCYSVGAKYFVYDHSGKISKCCCFGGKFYYQHNYATDKVKSYENGSAIYYSESDYLSGSYTIESGKKASYPKLDFNKVWEIAPDGSRPQLQNNRELILAKIEITKLPPKTVYNQGEDIVAGGEITVTCSNGKTAKANIDKSMLTYDMSKVGKQQVKVSYGGGECYFEITVNPIKATGISLNQSEIHMNKGENYSKLKAIISPDNATDKIVTWLSSDPTIAAIDENGIITAVDKGTVTIIAKTENEKAAACTVYIANPASSIALDNQDMHMGTKKTLKPVITPADTTSTLKWSSSNPSVASVSGNGVVTAVAPGQAEIKVETSDGPYATCLITVDAPTTAIVPAVKTKDMFVGNTYTLNVTVTPDYTTDTIICSSDNSRVASAVPVYKTVQVYDAQKDTYNEESRFAGCKITANAPGEATINITSANGKTAACKVTVKQPVESISLDYSNKTIELGETDKLTAFISPSEHDETIKWTSTHDEIVSVDQEGYLTTHATGVATIKVRSSSGQYAACKVTVTKTATDMQLSQTDLAIEKGKTKTVTCTLTPADATDKVTWTSSNESVATVKNGKITAVGAGTAQITAVTTGGLMAVVNVTVKVFAKSISLNKENIKLAKGTAQTLNVIFDPNDTTNKTITWTTSNSKVATVKNGKVTAVGAGTATITAKSANGKTASCEVLVYIVPNKVVLNKTSFTMNNGTQSTLTATVYPSASENKTITWRSSNASVATVGSNGTVTAKSSGTATITATTFNGISSSCTVTVVTNPGSISLNYNSLTLAPGKSTPLVATVLPSDADNKGITWKSSNTDVATVMSGMVSAVKAGTATITATTVNGLKATCTVTVKNPEVLPTSVALSKTSLSITAGNTATLTATVSPTNATNKAITWTTSNSGVATVSNGVVTAKSVGTATITAKTHNGKTATCTVTVTNPVVNPTSVSLNKTSVSLTVGNTATLTATVYPSNATNKTVTWTTSNSSVATVSGGKVTAKGAGTATITAKTANGKTATCTVTVTKPAETTVQKKIASLINTIEYYGSYNNNYEKKISKKIPMDNGSGVVGLVRKSSTTIFAGFATESIVNGETAKTSASFTLDYNNPNRITVEVLFILEPYSGSVNTITFESYANCRPSDLYSGASVTFYKSSAVNIDNSYINTLSQTFFDGCMVALRILLSEYGFTLADIGFTNWS